MATKNFETASRRGAAAVVNDIEIDFQIDGVEFTAHPPTTGQLALFLSAQKRGGMEMVQGLFDFLGAILDEDGVEAVREALGEGVDLAFITDIVTYLIGEWSGRPTQRSTASSASRKNTTKRSTVKQPAKPKTRSTSR